MSLQPLLRAEGLSRTFRQGGWLRQTSTLAVRDVSLHIMPGETLALVGESGSGKSTLGRLLSGLDQADSGSVEFAGQRIDGLDAARLRAVRRDLQVIFQDPYSAIDPRMAVADFVAEPLRVHKAFFDADDLQRQVAGLMRKVGLDPAMGNRRAREFSGGQRQRLCIARAIALKPKLIVADEPITALDVSIQAQIINLLMDLQQELGVTYLFISHDLSMVRHVSQRVAVMREGRIVELAPTAQLFSDPRHPYTQALLSAVPVPDPRIERARQRLYFDPQQHPIGDDASLRLVGPDHYVLG
ncbi:ATP-binding cassette domain-containing protein [Pseudomonas huaxiensis]|uniref:ATP-binding cassette domain-containing protein n=1 Tax=Pseudomonas huaxiensis TaxID=2213017 RepID=UPI000DA66B4F|nr:ATP-binding cassette domain-containing protein [Pseudomonas huaxiensis]